MHGPVACRLQAQACAQGRTLLVWRNGTPWVCMTAHISSCTLDHYLQERWWCMQDAACMASNSPAVLTACSCLRTPCVPTATFDLYSNQATSKLGRRSYVLPGGMVNTCVSTRVWLAAYAVALHGAHHAARQGLADPSVHRITARTLVRQNSGRMLIVPQLITLLRTRTHPHTAILRSSLDAGHTDVVGIR